MFEHLDYFYVEAIHVKQFAGSILLVWLVTCQIKPFQGIQSQLQSSISASQHQLALLNHKLPGILLMIKC